MSTATTLTKEIDELSTTIACLTTELKKKTERLREITSLAVPSGNALAETKEEKSLAKGDLTNKMSISLKVEDAVQLANLASSIKDKMTTRNIIVFTGSGLGKTYLTDLLKSYINRDAWNIQLTMSELNTVIFGRRQLYSNNIIKPPNLCICREVIDLWEDVADVVGQLCRGEGFGSIQLINNNIQNVLVTSDTNFIVTIHNEKQIDMLRKYVPPNKLHVYRFDKLKYV